ncbi:MAG: SRPBCC domain-containing protein [Agriterribacter sp.]
MENKVIEKAIEISAPLNKVWRVFTDPDITRQMGGHYDTEWKIGSSFGFKKADGNQLTSGTLLDFQPERLIRHSLFEPNTETIMAVLTYEFLEKDGVTLLTGKEELTHPLDKATFDDAFAGWASALDFVKRIAEAL